MFPIAGIYAITPPAFVDNDDWMRRIGAVLAGGVRLLQYRQADASEAQKSRRAEKLLHLCRRHGALFLINDDVDLALAVGADGVHLGQNDLSVATARQRLGTEKIIGASAYDNPAVAVAAQDDGANYVALGAVFPSPTKPTARHCPLAKIVEVRRRISLPIVAIGGIALENIDAVVAAGADAVAVISGLFAQSDIGAAASRLCRAYALARDGAGKGDQGLQ